MIVASPFYYLRHGETDWNLAGKVQGSSDIPLNDTGRQQARVAAESLKGLGLTEICVSPLDRARETARIVNEKLNLPITEIRDLREAEWGPFEGGAFGEWMQEWLSGKSLEGAEDYNFFLRRCADAINQAISGRPGPVLIVAHGAVYWTIKHHIMGVAKERVREEANLPNSIPFFHDPVLEETGDWRITAINSPESGS